MHETAKSLILQMSDIKYGKLKVYNGYNTFWCNGAKLGPKSVPYHSHQSYPKPLSFPQACIESTEQADDVPSCSLTLNKLAVIASRALHTGIH